MASYTYKCEKCETLSDLSHSMKESPSFLCKTCGESLKKTVSKNLNFVLKGTNWSGKNIKEKSYRAQRSKELGKKMVLNHDIPQIIPNYRGEPCNNWNEAKSLAVANGADSIKYEKQVLDLTNTHKKLEDKKNRLVKKC